MIICLFTLKTAEKAVETPSENYLSWFVAVGGPETSEGDGPSILHILKDIRVTSTLILTTYAGMAFTAVDPILEPELKNKVDLWLRKMKAYRRGTN